MGALKVWDGTQWQTASATGANQAVYVGPDAPAGTPRSGDLWYDSDADSPLVTPVSIGSGGTGASNAAQARTNLGVNLPLGLVDGGTGGTTAATARSSLAVPAVGQSGSTAGAPTSGTWVRGDQWLDSASVQWVCTASGTPGTWAAAQRKIQSANSGGTTDANGRLPITFPSAYTATPVVVGSYCTGPVGFMYVDGITPTVVTFRFFNASGTVAGSAAVTFFWIAVGNY